MRLIRVGMVVASLAVLCLEAIACRQVAGIDDRKATPCKNVSASGTSCEDPKATQCGNFTSSIATCASCIDEKCCEMATKCQEDPACANRMTCVLACEKGDEECRSRCVFNTTPGVYESLATLEHCISNQCSSPCGLTCGGLPLLVPEKVASKCQECIAASCCEQSKACSNKADCFRGIECFRGNYHPDKVEECHLQLYPNAVGELSAYSECIQNECRTVCREEGEWSCVGNVTWPKAEQTAILSKFQLVDVFTQELIKEPLELRVCELTDPSCQKNKGVIFDSQGIAEISLSTESMMQKGFSGFVAVFDPSPEPVFFPTFVWANPPFIVSGITRRVFMVRKSITTTVSQNLGVDIMLDRGHLGINVLDCNGIPSPNISVTIASDSQVVDDKTRPLYLQDGFPDKNRTFTSQDGVLQYLNLKPGLANFEARDVVADRVVARGSIVIVQPGTFYQLIIAPSPGL
jgi:hypothetical protein